MHPNASLMGFIYLFIFIFFESAYQLFLYRYTPAICRHHATPSVRTRIHVSVCILYLISANDNEKTCTYESKRNVHTGCKTVHIHNLPSDVLILCLWFFIRAARQSITAFSYCTCDLNKLVQMPFPPPVPLKTTLKVFFTPR